MRQAAHGPYRLLFDVTFGQPEVDWFSPKYWADLGQVRAADGGRGSAWFIDHADQSWVLRHYRRGGLMAKVSKDRYLFTGVARTRAFREWQLLFALQARSLPAPRPVAAGVVRLGVTYRAHLLTVAIPDTQTLAQRLADDSLDAALMTATGHCVARFHAHGVWHADLNAHNILVNSAGDVFVIDFDRGVLRQGAHWKQGNIDRLARSLNKLARHTGRETFDSALWAAFETGYRSAGQ